MIGTPPEFRRGNKWMVSLGNAIVKFFLPNMVNPAGRPGWVSTPNGWIPPKGSTSSAGQRPPLAILASGSDGVTMTDGRVHVSSHVGGLSEDVVPEINGTAINDATPPVLALAAGENDIFAKIELVPASEVVPQSSPTLYRIGGFNEVVSLDIVTTAASQTPTINTTTGAVTDNLIASFHMGTATKTTTDGVTTIAVTKPQNRFGPISIAACGPAIAVSPPVFLVLSDAVLP